MEVGNKNPASFPPAEDIFFHAGTFPLFDQRCENLDTKIRGELIYRCRHIWAHPHVLCGQIGPTWLPDTKTWSDNQHMSAWVAVKKNTVLRRDAKFPSGVQINYWYGDDVLLPKDA